MYFIICTNLGFVVIVSRRRGSKMPIVVKDYWQKRGLYLLVRIVYLEKKTMDKRLEQLLSSKDGEAFCMRLTGAAISVLGDESLAQDVVQDTFEYFSDRDVPVKNAEEVEPYLLVTVRNRAITMKKKLARTAIVDIEKLDTYTDCDSDQSCEEEWQYATMEACIKRLERQSQRVFRLRYLKGLSIKTVARMMRMSKSMVARISNQAINDITKMMKDEQKKRE